MERVRMKELETTVNKQQAEIALLRSVMDNLPASVYWKDIDGVYLGCNKYASEKMVSVGLASTVSEDIMVGKTDYDLFPEEVADRYRENDSYVIQTGNESTYEEAVTLPSGETIVQLSNKKPLRDANSKIIGIIGNTVEITALKKAEEREKLALAHAAEEEAKAQAEAELRQSVMILAGSIAHDLRTPIAVINMDGQALDRIIPDLITVCSEPSVGEALESHNFNTLKLNSLKSIPQGIIKTAQKMQAFIDVTLKTLSKAVAKEFTQDDLVRCSMWHCVHNTLARFPFVSGQQELIKNQTKDFSFLGNELLMIRILSNLLNNALQQIDRNKKGEIFLSTDTSNPSVNVLRFKDTAGGALPEIVEHIFDGYKTTKAKGTGIGLSFCRLAMENFGGTIACNSVYGDHIEFLLSFPKIMTET